ncbi:cilia- and flagella-associated protein 61-like [Condylostylus longicornis]|uniref:cilia- and flagella-associated protein 61-like n=1 Tax=Condylostylus longicornis TaxID=2530218 RepID=UPI00244E1E7E|nr:cilia- and flagella-associated protein 61-like [Condylostylus longicornis]
MYPVEPNIVYNIRNTNKEEQLTEPLYFRSLKNSQNPFLNIDTKICCIGFDDVCKGFLKQLIFDKKYINYKFTNIIVIADPAEFEFTITDLYRKICNLLKVDASTSPQIMKRMGLETWISCIGGKIASIDRKSKTIFMSNFYKIKYDYLFLVCSINYGYPNNLIWNSTDPAPSNYVQINNIASAALFYHKLSMIKEIFQTGFDIIVYGSVLYSYSCLNFLLEQNIPGNQIHFVQIEIRQEDEMNIEGFRDPTVTELILNELKKANINIYTNYRFVKWSLCEETNRIKSVTFASKFNAITLPCQLFWPYN